VLPYSSAERCSKNRSSGHRHPAGKYVTTTLKAAAADNASSDFWSVLAFGDTAGAELLRLGINERVTIQGGLKLEISKRMGRRGYRERFSAIT